MSSCINSELADAGLGLAEEVAVEEDGVEDSSLGELSFFMKGRKKYRLAFLDSDHSSTIAFRFTGQILRTVLELWLHQCGFVYLCLWDSRLCYSHGVHGLSFHFSHSNIGVVSPPEHQ